MQLAQLCSPCMYAWMCKSGLGMRVCDVQSRMVRSICAQYVEVRLASMLACCQLHDTQIVE